MAHFHFDNAISEATRLDAPIQKGPLMRWQRKALESGVRSLSISEASSSNGPLSSKTPNSARTPNTPFSPLNIGSGNVPKSPKIQLGGALCTMDNFINSPGKALRIPLNSQKSPNKSMKVPIGKTPKKSTPTTPGKNLQQDRFIPNRSGMDMDTGHFLVMKLTGKTSQADMENINPNETEGGEPDYQRKMAEALNQPEESHKILAYNNKAPLAREGHLNNLKVLYSAGPSGTAKGATNRVIPQTPERVLDAPELIDDYYLNLLSWSANNHVAVCLGGEVYVWNAGNGSITQLMEMEGQDEYVSSVSWIKEGNILAIGNSLGAVQLWDVGASKLIRSMGGHASRVGSLAWNSYIVSSGSRSGAIHHHDVRVADHHVGTLANHSQEVCGLAWSPDGRLLASGGNDNLVNIWESTLDHSAAPLHTFTYHQAAVKALAWCPWQPSLLATGGGTADRHIRFWNTGTGTCVNSIDTNSQVCSILWSKECRELISGHGFSQNQLTIWKYPSMARIAELTGHRARVLCLAMSPDGSTVASAAADETIRLWQCFSVETQRKPTTTKSTKEKVDRGTLSRVMNIR